MKLTADQLHRLMANATTVAGLRFVANWSERAYGPCPNPYLPIAN